MGVKNNSSLGVGLLYRLVTCDHPGFKAMAMATTVPKAILSRGPQSVGSKLESDMRKDSSATAQLHQHASLLLIIHYVRPNQAGMKVPIEQWTQDNSRSLKALVLGLG